MKISNIYLQIALSIIIAALLQVTIMGNAFADHEVGDFGPLPDAHNFEDPTASLVLSLGMLTKLLAAHPNDLDLHVALCQAHLRYGDILREQGDEKEAISEYRAALAAVDVAVGKRDRQTIRDLKTKARNSLKELTNAAPLGHPAR